MHFSDLKDRECMVSTVCYKNTILPDGGYDYELTQILSAANANPFGLLRVINCYEFLIPEDIKNRMSAECFHIVNFIFDRNNYCYEFLNYETIDDSNPNKLLFLH